MNEREELRKQFDLIADWLSFIGEGYELHDQDRDGNVQVTSVRDAYAALDALRTYVLGRFE